MATEYIVQSDADVRSDELTGFFESTLGELATDRTIVLPGLFVTPDRPPEDERDETTRRLGFDHRVTATFRFHNLADPQTRDHNVAVMVGAVLAFYDRFGGSGALFYNDDVLTVQWTPREIVVNRDWTEFFEIDAVVAVIGDRPVRHLGQPLL
ncbi:hypothetical protein ACWT_5631 [Actinoplanes sp. SE50]|uniref:SitI3 family protein n=1 Tax=unclassified Actinoplanes TaxID=2626549 RepID=UPI00023ED0FB|nr:MULTISPECIES: SitI3 family protein [unclassified Actinoplanes]AEV86648.1 hypothetical protein ACPL_5761 [Actinoplanes sp. SE50/110]ATO85046.1 hypothetical protein ACWT_5631 [Actinoplanes sp. SE50]SLM02456.1 hypothetical protein ACSP50_5706 [Actinoplanes sp. SE50/110]